MPSTAEEIKQKIDIVDLLKSYITLLPAGKNFKAVCPFHKEKTPSFMVSPDRQTWHCFGSCNMGGDVFTFLMKYENIEFFEALRILAEKVGIELKRANPAEQRQFGVLYDMNKTAKNFYASSLKENKAVLNYAHSRGLKDGTIEEFEIGFAPNKFDALTLVLINQGFSVADIERSGLAFKSERGGYLDRFRGRLMFPIDDHFGKAVAFTGRILPEFDNGTSGKYVNSPETAIFKKSKIFYGFHKNKNAIRDLGMAFLVEGQMDFLMAHQDGVRNVLAASGTALTQDHLTVLRRQADKLILGFDSDEAGIQAAERAIDLGSANDFEVGVVTLPQGVKDPAEFVEKYPGKLAELIDKGAKPAMEFYFDRYLANGSDKRSVRAVLAKIAYFRSPIDKNIWVKKLSERSSIPEKNLIEEMEQSGKSASIKAENESAPASPIDSENIKPVSRLALISENLISLGIAKGDLDIVQKVKEYLPQKYQDIISLLKNPENLRLGASGAPGANYEGETGALINSLYLRSGVALAHSENDLCMQLKLEYLKEEKQKLARAVKEFEAKGNLKELQKAMRELDLLTKQIHNLRC
ncbi:MAG: DNA primase [Candidatus Liptonbacteria bacterium]|nr:DNA primase [Candidatus Liptonbacteria bacterium]